MTYLFIILILVVGIYFISADAYTEWWYRKQQELDELLNEEEEDN